AGLKAAPKRVGRSSNSSKSGTIVGVVTLRWATARRSNSRSTYSKLVNSGVYKIRGSPDWRRSFFICVIAVQNLRNRCSPFLTRPRSATTASSGPLREERLENEVQRRCPEIVGVCVYAAAGGKRDGGREGSRDRDVRIEPDRRLLR